MPIPDMKRIAAATIVAGAVAAGGMIAGGGEAFLGGGRTPARHPGAAGAPAGVPSGVAAGAAPGAAGAAAGAAGAAPGAAGTDAGRRAQQYVVTVPAPAAAGAHVVIIGTDPSGKPIEVWSDGRSTYADGTPYPGTAEATTVGRIVAGGATAPAATPQAALAGVPGVVQVVPGPGGTYVVTTTGAPSSLAQAVTGAAVRPGA